MEQNPGQVSGFFVLDERLGELHCNAMQGAVLFEKRQAENTDDFTVGKGYLQLFQRNFIHGTAVNGH